MSGIGKKISDLFKDDEPVAGKEPPKPGSGQIEINFNFIKKYFYHISLFLTIVLATFLRTRNLKILNGTELIELDSSNFFRYAKYILEHGSLMATDFMRNAPIGVDLAHEPIGGTSKFFSYAMAYMYKFSGLFGLTQKEWHIIYPPVITIGTIIFIFLFVKILFGKRAAIVSALLFAVIPGTIQRTGAGFADHDALALFFMFISFYLFAKAWTQKESKKGIILGALSSLSAIACAFTWGGSRFLSISIALFGIFGILFLNLSRLQKYILIEWSVIFIILHYFFKGFNLDFGLLGIVIIAILFDKLLNNKFKIDFPKRIISVVLPALLLFIIGIAFRLINVGETMAYVIKPHSVGRIAETVSENQQPFFMTENGWWGQFGIFFFILLIGAIYLIYSIFNNSKKFATVTSISFGILFSAAILGRFSQDPKYTGITNFFTNNYIYLILLFLLIFIGYYIYIYYKDPEEFKKVCDSKWQPLLIFLWFLLAAIMARGAVRMLFSFVPIAAIVSGIFIAELYSKNIKVVNRNLLYNGLISGFGLLIIYSLIKKIGVLNNFTGVQKNASVFVFLVALFIITTMLQKYNILDKDEGNKYISWAMILIILVSIISVTGFIRTSYQFSSGSYSGYTDQWKATIDWIKTTPEDSIFAHWWDYGYWIQAEGNRATVTDGGHPSYPYTDFYVGRDLLTAPNEKTAFEFLKSRKVDYVLLTREEIGKYFAFSSIGSINHDRASTIGIFRADKSATQEGRNNTKIVYRGSWTIDTDLKFGNKVFTKFNAAVGAIVFTLDPSSAVTEAPLVVLADSTGQYSVKTTCLIDANKVRKTFEVGEEPHLNDCIQFVPDFKGSNEIDSLPAAFYVSEMNSKGLFARLYMFDEKINGFDIAYTDSQPLGLYGGMITGPTKIFKVTYPAGIEVQSKYIDPNAPSPY